jgi:WD40 repeat protein
MLASRSGGDTIILWDVETHTPIGQFPTGSSMGINSVAFSPNGKILAVGNNGGVIILWDMDPESWIKKSCQRAGRNYTRVEWAQYFPNEEYRKTCGQWDLEP